MDKKLNCKEAFVFSTIATINLKTEQLDFTQNSLIVITAAGIITGTYVSDQMKEKLENDAAYITFENINVLSKDFCEDTSNAILLKNVVLTTSNGFQNRFNYLYVFIDDILALSYGNMLNN